MSDAKFDEVTFIEGGSTILLTEGTLYSDSFNVSKYRELILLVDVNENARESFYITLQVSPNNSLWADHGAVDDTLKIGIITASTQYEQRFMNFSRWIRIKYSTDWITVLGAGGVVGTVKT